MADRYAVASGNWSDTATWDGGTTLPTAGDVVRPSGFTVTIDQDITVGSLTNSTSTLAPNGSFAMSGNRTINANLLAASTTSSVTLLSIAASQTATINGTVTSGASSAHALSTGASSNVTINGDCLAVSSGWIITSMGVGTTLTINGNVTGGSNAGALQISQSSIVTINGDVLGVAASGNQTISMFAIGCTLTINGTVTGGATSNAKAVYAAAATGQINVTGNVYGGGWSGAYGLSVGSGINVSVIGDLAVTLNDMPAAIYFDTGALDIVGDIKAVVGAEYAQVLYVPSGRWRFGGTVEWGCGANGFPIGRMVVNSSIGVIFEQRDDDLWPASVGATPKYVSSYPSGLPIPADVREGTTYNVGDSDTGTLAVPAAGSVALGVPVDDTVGSAVLNAEDIWAVDADSLPDGSVGKRMAVVSTVESTGAQIAAALDG